MKFKDFSEANHEMCEKVASFLDVPETVFLGCTCHSFKARCEIIIQRKMVSWKQQIMERELKERMILEEEHAYRVEEYRLYRDQTEDEKEETIKLSASSNDTPQFEEEISNDDDSMDSDDNSIDIETKAKELKVYLHKELRAHFEELESRVDTFDRLYFKITMMSIAEHGIEELNRFFNVANACQGGPIKVKAMHFAAIYGNASLCCLLFMRSKGSNSIVNPNICIPNDQHSHDKSLYAANMRADYDWSQYVYGMITPLRLAMTFKQLSTVRYLKQIGGLAGIASIASLKHETTGSIFSSRGATGFSTLNRNNSCWTNKSGDKIYYVNSYMHGERVYPGILFRQGHNVMTDGEPENDEFDRSKILRDLGLGS